MDFPWVFLTKHLHLENKAAQACVIWLHMHGMSLINGLALNEDEQSQLA